MATEGPDAGNKEDVRNYLRGATVPTEDYISLSINIAMYLLSGIEYLETKAELAHAASRKFDSYNSDYVQAETLQNQIIQGTLTKASALENLNNAIVANDECFQLMKTYLVKEPTRDPYEGSQMLLGRDNFTTDIDDASIIAALNEGRNEELRAGLRTIDERQIAERRNIPYFDYPGTQVGGGGAGGQHNQVLHQSKEGLR